MKLHKRLDHAARNDLLVRVYREAFESEYIVGYVVGAGPDNFVLEIISTSIQFDGYCCMQYSDVSKYCIPDPDSEFLEKALSLRGESPKGNPGVDLSTSASILETASLVFETVNIRLEESEPRACYIGRVTEITATQVKLRTITPNGEWEEGIAVYNLKDVTRIDFGGKYDEVLVLVAEDTRVH